MHTLLSPLRQRITRQRGWLVVCSTIAVIFIIFTLGILAAHKMHVYSSDDVAQQTLIATQGQYGQHKDWLGVDNFLLKLPFYDLINSIAGQSRTALLITVVSFNTFAFAGIIAALYLVWREQLKNVPAKIPAIVLVALLGLLWVCSLGGDLASALVNPNVRNAEIGICIFLAVLTLTWALKPRARWYWGAFLGLVIGAFLFNDPYFLYTLFMPLAIVPLYYYFFNKKGFEQTRPLRLYGVLLVAAVVYKLGLLVAEALHYHVYDANIAFADLTTFGKNLTNLAVSFVVMFHANIFGQGISPDTLRVSLNTILAVILMALTVRYVIKRRELSPSAALFGLTAVSVVLLYVLTTSSDIADTSRYLVLLPFTLFFMVPFVLDELKNERIKWALITLLALASVSNVYSIVHDLHKPSIDPNGPNIHVVSELSTLKLSKGFSGYWDSNITTYLSKNQSVTIPVVCDGQALHIYYWLMDSAWLNKKADSTYLIVNALEPSFKNCTPEKIDAQFGAPAQLVKLDANRSLCVYDYDITAILMAPDSKVAEHIKRRNYPY